MRGFFIFFCWFFCRELSSVSAKAHWHSNGAAPKHRDAELDPDAGRRRCGLADLSLTPLLPAPWPLQLRKDREVIIGGSQSTKAAAQRQLQGGRKRAGGGEAAEEPHTMAPSP